MDALVLSIAAFAVDVAILKVVRVAGVMYEDVPLYFIGLILSEGPGGQGSVTDQG